MSDFDNIQKMIDDMNTEIADLRATYQKKTQGLFKKAFLAFFEQNPEVTAVGWRQYTPYFNDGDTCEFSTYVPYAWVTNAKDLENLQPYGEYAGEDEGVWIDNPDHGDHGDVPPSVTKNAEALRKLLVSVSDDMYKEMFGDHVTVTATREGFEVNDHNHE